MQNSVAYYRKQRGLSQSELAAKVGTTLNMLGKLERGDRNLDTDWLEKIGDALKVEPYLLLAPLDAADKPTATHKASPTDDEVEIDSIDLSYGMGGSFVDYERGALEISKAKFSREWLRKFTHTSPDLLFTTSGVGDSMAPTINDQDVVIVDRSITRLEEVMGEKIWAIVFGGVGMIKRLRPLPDGTVKIMSDNQLVRDELAADNDLYIIGRVVGSVRRH